MKDGVDSPLFCGGCISEIECPPVKSQTASVQTQSAVKPRFPPSSTERRYEVDA